MQKVKWTLAIGFKLYLHSSACDIQFVGEIFHVRYMGRVELSKETKFGVSNLVLCCFRSYQIDKSPSLRTKIGLPSLVFSL